jgi:hypothetical protein
VPPAGSGHQYELTELLALLPRPRARHDDRDGDGLADDPMPPLGAAARAYDRSGLAGMPMLPPAPATCRDISASAAPLMRPHAAAAAAHASPGAARASGAGTPGLCWARGGAAAALDAGAATLVEALAGPDLQPHRPALAAPLPLAAASVPAAVVAGPESGPSPDAGSGLQPAPQAPGAGRQGVWGAYELGAQYARGSFGEVWRAVRRRGSGRTPDTGLGPGAAGGGAMEDAWGSEGGAEQGFVLKRILGARGSDAWLSGRREEYFGHLFRASQARAAAGGVRGGAEHVVRFVEALEVRYASR